MTENRTQEEIEYDKQENLQYHRSSAVRTAMEASKTEIENGDITLRELLKRAEVITTFVTDGTIPEKDDE